MDWINLAKGRNPWRAIVKTAVDLLVSWATVRLSRILIHPMDARCHFRNLKQILSVAYVTYIDSPVVNPRPAGVFRAPGPSWRYRVCPQIRASNYIASIFLTNLLLTSPNEGLQRQEVAGLICFQPITEVVERVSEFPHHKHHPRLIVQGQDFKIYAGFFCNRGESASLTSFRNKMRWDLRCERGNR